MDTRRDVFQAIADPTRRKIIHIISNEALNLNAIADQFEVSRSAISQHIKILAECGLVVIHQQGRERICKARLVPLLEVSNWVSQYETFWNQKLDALGEFLDNSKSK